MCPYEFICHLHIEEDDINIPCFLKHVDLTLKERIKFSFGHYNYFSQYKQIWLASLDVPLGVPKGLHPKIVLETIKKKYIWGTTKESRNITLEHVKTL